MAPAPVALAGASSAPLVDPRRQQRRAHSLRPLEISYGLAVGRLEGIAQLPGSVERRSARAAFEHTILTALQRPPCVVSFSGGLDSSTLLALAVHVARKHDLPDPTPATLVFDGSEASDETEWQHLVLDHLGVDQDSWVKIPITDELDAVGPVAREMLLRHGLVWPFNLHCHVPIMQVATGGTVVTGFGGDEIGRTSGTLFAERLIRRRRVRKPRHVALIAYRLSPPPVKYAREVFRRHTFRKDLPWLTARGRLALRFAIAGEHTLPFGWGPVLRTWLWRRRYFQICRRNFDVVGAHHDVRVVHPFVEAEVLQALPQGRYAGMGGRRNILEALFGDLLPQALLDRSTKATFNDPIWTATAIDFARAWSGRGLDPRFVDPEAVRRAWLSDDRTAMATTMLQAAWLADHGAPGRPAAAAPKRSEFD